jgi:hypothetical protein
MAPFYYDKRLGGRKDYGKDASNHRLLWDRLRAVPPVLYSNYDDGRSKSFFCLAAALLSSEHLKSALAEATADCGTKSKAKAIRAALGRYAESEGIELVLKK